MVILSLPLEYLALGLLVFLLIINSFFYTSTAVIKGGINMKQPVRQVPGNTFAVLEDENGVKTRIPASTGEWEKPPTSSTIAKENTQKPGKWNKGKVRCFFRALV